MRNLADEPADERPGRDPESPRGRGRAGDGAGDRDPGRDHRPPGRRSSEAVVGRGEAEAAHAEEERRVAGLVRAAADRREGLARLTGQVNTLKSRAAAAEDEIGRLSGAREEAEARAERAQREFTSLETRIAGLDAGERGLDAEHEGAAALLDDIDDRLAKLREEAQAAERERAALVARKEALEIGLSRKDGAGALLAASEDVSGLLGSVAALLSVRARLRDGGGRVRWARPRTPWP